MRQAGIQGAKRRGKPWRTTTPDPTALRAPDRVDRDFTASRPDELWVADFTYLRCWEGVVFFAFVLDVYSRRIVGWQFASHMRTDLVLDALRMALTRRPAGADVELIHHSDAGSQYTSYDFGQVLDDHGVLASIGSVGDAFDNAMAESFVDSFKTELIADRVWQHPHAAPAGHRRIRRLVQQRAPARSPRRPPAGRVRGPLRCPDSGPEHAHRSHHGNQLTRSPSNPARLTGSCAA
jgi:transposase InsO family protein